MFNIEWIKTPGRTTEQTAFWISRQINLLTHFYLAFGLEFRIMCAQIISSNS